MFTHDSFIFKGRGRTRRACTKPVVVTPVTIPSPRSYRAKVFGNLKGIVDSEESEDNNSPKKAKRIISLDIDSEEENNNVNEQTNHKAAKKRKRIGDDIRHTKKKRMLINQSDEEGESNDDEGVDEEVQSDKNTSKGRKSVMTIESSDED